MTAEVKACLLLRKSNNGHALHVFPDLAGRTAATHSTNFSRLMDRAEVSKEITLPTGEKAKRSFHSLRHTFISWMTNQPIQPEVRKALAGHSSSKTA
ncbi:MAG: hypothetical protein HC845_11795 [Akkermansiaceae bacterium]|nr:hypothetical protein [Akkermansiaceae bacterium]